MGGAGTGAGRQRQARLAPTRLPRTPASGRTSEAWARGVQADANPAPKRLESQARGAGPRNPTQPSLRTASTFTLGSKPGACYQDVMALGPRSSLKGHQLPKKEKKRNEHGSTRNTPLRAPGISNAQRMNWEESVLAPSSLISKFR